jgi:predicted Zn-dependent peptidase
MNKRQIGNLPPNRAIFCLVGALVCLTPLHCRANLTPPTAVQSVTLPDGVRLLLKPEASTDITAVTLFIRIPSAPSSEVEAVAEMVAYALFYGSTDRTRDGIALSVAQVGGVLETLRTPDYVAVTCVTVPDQIEDVARMLGEALKHADFGPEALERARADILRAYRGHNETGYDLGCDRIRALLTGADTPTAAQLQLVTHEQAIGYFTRHYVPAHTVVSVVGRFTPAVVETSFRAYFSEYERPASAFPARSPSPEPLGQQQSVAATVTLPTGKAAYALVGTPAPTIESQDAPAFAVLHALLGVGHASRLFRQVRDTTGFGYSVGADYRADLSAPLTTYIQWDIQRTDIAVAGTKQTAAEAIHRLNAQLDSILSDPPKDEEIERARNVAIGRDALRHERVRNRAFLLGWYEAMGPGYAYDNEYPRLLAAVTQADVLRVAQKYLGRRSSVVVTPNP